MISLLLNRVLQFVTVYQISEWRGDPIGGMDIMESRVPLIGSFFHISLNARPGV